MNNFDCKICNKVYKNKSGKWKHDNKYHTILPQNTTILPQNTTILPQNTTILPQNTTILPQNTTKNNLECTYCKKILSRYDSLKRHELICTHKLKYEDNIKQDNLDKIKEELKKDIMNDILKNCKIHPKTLQKINKQLINNNNINNGNINNGTINNIQIVKFGSENIKDLLNEKEIMKIFSSWYNAIEESIKEVHFNDNRPEYRNILITNLRDNIAYVYNGNKFEAVQKNSVISDLIEQHMNNIEVSLENYKNKLPKKTANILDKLLQKLEDDETKITDENNNKEYKNFKSYKTNEIKLMIYNESKKNTEVIKFQL
jgi:hypothetical protein